MSIAGHTENMEVFTFHFHLWLSLLSTSVMEQLKRVCCCKQALEWRKISSESICYSEWVDASQFLLHLQCTGNEVVKDKRACFRQISCKAHVIAIENLFQFNVSVQMMCLVAMSLFRGLNGSHFTK